jgi:hypothetical protein
MGGNMNIALMNHGVTALDARECETVHGGSDWGYAVGYTVGLMLTRPWVAVANALDGYFG